MSGYCRRCHLFKFLYLSNLCNNCSIHCNQDNKNYGETNIPTDPNIDLRQSSSILKDIDQVGNDW